MRIKIIRKNSAGVLKLCESFATIQQARDRFNRIEKSKAFKIGHELKAVVIDDNNEWEILKIVKRNSGRK